MGTFHCAKYLRSRKCYKKANKVNVTFKGNAYVQKGGKSLRRKILLNVNEFSENILNLTIKINREIGYVFYSLV
jgi:hypothetical protein